MGASKKTKLIVIGIVCAVLLALACVLILVVVPSSRYNKAVNLLESGSYADA